MAGLIGVLGGTFDPPHLGHLILADEARHELRLDRVLWVVTGVPPHKPVPPKAAIEARLDMVAAAIDGVAGFEVSRADVDRPPPHFALGTIRWLADRMPEARFVYLMGADSLAQLPTWHRPADMVAACEALGIAPRAGAELDWGSLEAAIPGIRPRCRFFPSPSVGISARDIRSRIGQGRPYRFLVPGPVAAVIEARGLYR
jgi:nicotinate-nucleotide adenylyltransferase